MATCPQCGGYLNDHHRCVGLWRLRLRAWAAVLGGGLVGGVAGGLLLTVVLGQASWLAVAVAASVGGLVVIALQRT